MPSCKRREHLRKSRKDLNVKKEKSVENLCSHTTRKKYNELESCSVSKNKIYSHGTKEASSERDIFSGSNKKKCSHMTKRQYDEQNRGSHSKKNQCSHIPKNHSVESNKEPESNNKRCSHMTKKSSLELGRCSEPKKKQCPHKLKMQSGYQNKGSHLKKSQCSRTSKKQSFESNKCTHLKKKCKKCQSLEIARCSKKKKNQSFQSDKYSSTSKESCSHSAYKKKDCRHKSDEILKERDTNVRPKKCGGRDTLSHSKREEMKLEESEYLKPFFPSNFPCDHTGNEACKKCGFKRKPNQIQGYPGNIPEWGRNQIYPLLQPLEIFEECDLENPYDKDGWLIKRPYPPSFLLDMRPMTDLGGKKKLDPQELVNDVHKTLCQIFERFDDEDGIVSRSLRLRERLLNLQGYKRVCVHGSDFAEYKTTEESASTVATSEYPKEANDLQTRACSTGF
ncbi:hypothetical protein LAZ67_10001928 [Cordylochernes scorpioides]|uniref:Uncharacterized protein n=1 Tax=Cordylochernes scorpioides TaxID=51811 RepID=A0ABY6KWA6_9ARAC|nr:hypothetical protein LAZ67_10001928 [Cordylochernes scorpioides]